MCNFAINFGLKSRLFVDFTTPGRTPCTFLAPVVPGVAIKYGKDRRRCKPYPRLRCAACVKSRGFS
jgi:hypothetical protein